VSEKPNQSVPSHVYEPGTQREIWSGTERIQSETATTGAPEPAPASADVTYGVRGSSSGCSRLCDSTARASRRSSVHEVTDHTSAATPQSSASSCRARSAHGMATPEARILAPAVDGAAAYRYMPRRMPSSSPSSSGAGGCGYGSL
jgi:hypothetical protein